MATTYPVRAEARGFSTAYLLTAATAVIMATVSAVGAFAEDWLYRDNALVTATFRGQDMITLVVAVPHESQPFTDALLRVKACRHFLPSPPAASPESA